MKLTWTDAIGIFAFLQLVLLAIVTFNHKKGKRLSNRILSAFMASNALLIGQFLLRRFGWISSTKLPLLTSIGSSAYLLLMPLLFLYIRSLCYKDFRLKRRHLLHALPFLGLTLLSLTHTCLAGYLVSRDSWTAISTSLSALDRLAHPIILHLQVFSYLTASVVLLMAYRKQLKDLYSSIERINLSWINILLLSFAAMWLMDFTQWIGRLAEMTWQHHNPLLFLSLFINLLFTLAVVYKGIAQSDSFSGIKSPSRYAKSRLTISDCESITRKVVAYIEAEKLYLVRSLTVEELARKVRVPTKHLSQSIHTSLNLTFYDLINRYRIEEAKKRMQQEANRRQTLLALLYEIGFNSKSVFNEAFKKHAGMTPKEYRKMHSR
jgi:AraC-like DNA-binding protein